MVHSTTLMGGAHSPPMTAVKIMRSAIYRWKTTHRAAVTQLSVTTRSVITWTVVLTWLSVMRLAPVWDQASVTASRSAHLVTALLLTSITPALSAASTMSRLATPAAKYQYMSI